MIFKVFCINLIECVCLTNELIKLNAALFAHLVVHEKRSGSAGPSAKALGLKKIEKKVLPSFEIRKFTVVKELNWN